MAAFLKIVLALMPWVLGGVSKLQPHLLVLFGVKALLGPARNVAVG